MNGVGTTSDSANLDPPPPIIDFRDGKSFQPVPVSTLRTLESCISFVHHCSPGEIAAQLVHDEKIANAATSLPSLLAHVLPEGKIRKKQNHPYNVPRSLIEDVSHALAVFKWGLGPDSLPAPYPAYRSNSLSYILHSGNLPALLYVELIGKLRRYLATAIENWEGVPEQDCAGPEVPATGGINNHLRPTDQEYSSALKVLRYLQFQPPEEYGRHQLAHVIKADTPMLQILRAIEREMQPSLRPTPFASDSNKCCYICRFKMRDSHRIYQSLCWLCGEFNISACAETLPSALRLHGKTAVVTGARVNLGYHTVLRLLRCGAHVMATTRYPFDAQERYFAEPDMAEWKSRLKIIGADFRSARDAFGLVGVVKEWLVNEVGTEKLDILINNAAQTLTDKVEAETMMVEKEATLQSLSGAEEKQENTKWIVDSEAYRYQARVRGGVRSLELQPPSASTSNRLIAPSDHKPDSPISPSIKHQQEPGDLSDNGTSIAHPPAPVWKSSWTQKLPEVPYIDILTAHSINAFVPLILTRELLSSLSHGYQPQGDPDDIEKKLAKDSNVRPTAYVINISSRESIRESTPSHSSKNGHHVHTNMSKAALNMLTHTEAGAAWKTCKVSMNSVDPGYMSADKKFLEMVGKPEITELPLKWEDGVGRVLWAIAKGEKQEPVWGRFLKHFTAVKTAD